MIRVLLALLAIPQAPSPTVPGDSYADSATEMLVRRARAARDRNERLVTAYTATAKQRIGVGIRARSRDRMLYRQELVARIDWKRDAPSRLDIVGAREGIPIALRGDRLPEDLSDEARGLVYNPAQDYFRLLNTEDDDGFVYPLKEGGEVDYRFAAGDTAVITLPDGKRIRLVSLEVIPRRSDWRLLAGTMWFDADSYGLVRLVFRPARPFEFRRDVSDADREDVPPFVNPVGEVKFVTVEYALYENRWWMLRYMAADIVGSMGSWLGMPIKFERIYEDYEVQGGTPPDTSSRFRPAGTIRGRERDDEPRDTVALRLQREVRDAAIQRCIDEAIAASRDEEDPRVTGRRERTARRGCRTFVRDSNLVVHIPIDTAAVLASPELGPPILAMGDMISEEEIRGLRSEIEGLPGPLYGTQLALPSGVTSVLQHARYNRVEALSLGTGATLTLGAATVRGTARLGLADLVPNAEVGIFQTSVGADLGVAVYRRLDAANPDVIPFGPFNSFFGLVAGRDDGEYFRTLGAEARAGDAAGRWTLRVFAQRERPAFVETSASLPRLFNGDRTFRPNILADSADAFGASLSLHGTRALSPAIALGGDFTLDGVTGDYDFARASATARLYVTPGGPLAGGLTLSAGTTRGTVPTQHLFYLGGANTLRGYSGGVLGGEAYWNARLEVGNSFPAARLIGFTDLGWAGDRDAFRTGRPLIGAGVGASFLDGLVRIDLARGLRAPTGWRLEFYVDGIL